MSLPSITGHSVAKKPSKDRIGLGHLRVEFGPAIAIFFTDVWVRRVALLQQRQPADSSTSELLSASTFRWLQTPATGHLRHWPAYDRTSAHSAAP